MIPLRVLGKTGVRLSLIGCGGIAVMREDQERADELVNASIEAGVNYFDVAPSYGDAEVKFGNALEPWRDRIFLACKTTVRDREGAWKELQNSLRRLRTGRVELYQFHALNNVNEVEIVLGKGGALEAFLRARKEGLIKYIGFSSHSPAASLKAIREFDFDTVLFPVNFVLHFQYGFEKEVLKEAREREMGILALKALAKQRWPEDADRKQRPKCWYQPIEERKLARLALFWTLSQGVTAAVPPGDAQLYKDALELAGGYMELTADEVRRLKSSAADMTPIFFHENEN